MTETLFGYWDTMELPEDIGKLQESWKRYWPYEIKVYNDETAREFILEHFDDVTLSLFDIIRLPAMKSDFFRVLKLFRVGGVYLDMGVELGPNAASLLPRDDVTIMRKWHGGIWNGFASCQPETTFFKEVLHRINDNLKNRKDGDVFRITGPHIWSGVVKEKGHPVSILDQQKFIVKNNVFKVRNDLEHKKKGNHWSEKQLSVSIYLD